MEESNFMDGNFDTQKTQMISELETLIETYKKENESLLADLSKLEKIQASAPTTSESLKRTHDETTSPTSQDEEKIGQLTRRARHYQEEVTRLKRSEAITKKELKAANSRIAALEQSVLARKRVLELKDNPTSRHEAVKAEELRILRAENDGLLQLLEKKPRVPGTEVVPAASIKAITHTLEELKKQIAEKEKRMARLKQIWTQKSVEWRQAVHSIVGILFDFLPNGRVRVSSREWYDPSAHGSSGEGDNSEDPGIVFDGEQGTMRISPEGFSRAIAPLVKLWAVERDDIPGLIAALTIGRSRETGEGSEGDGMEE
ncbi:spindle assembly checkpoint component Mad1 [Peziza echinospora]|nr:spindle assembly checkpoint component Mad1 [Peziza echinospora]